jgi:cytochrome c553
MIAIAEPIAVGVLVSLWSSLWSKYILPALCATCHEEDETSSHANSAVSSDLEVHIHSF